MRNNSTTRKRLASGNKASREGASRMKQNVTSKDNQEKTTNEDTSINEDNVYVVVNN